MQPLAGKAAARCVVRYLLRPTVGTPSSAPSRTDPDYLAADAARRLRTGPARMELCIQRYRDPTSTPIEDTAVGKFIVQSLANVAELHRNLNAQNVKNRMKARLQAGYWVFENPPGYTFQTVAGHGRMLVPDEPTASAVREANKSGASTVSTVHNKPKRRGRLMGIGGLLGRGST